MSPDRQSTLNKVGIPNEWRRTLLIFALILLLSPYMGGVSFGTFSVPAFPEPTKEVLRWLGPVVFFLILLLSVPLTRTSVTVIAVLAGLSLVIVAWLPRPHPNPSSGTIRELTEKYGAWDQVTGGIGQKVTLLANYEKPVHVTTNLSAGVYRLVLEVDGKEEHTNWNRDDPPPKTPFTIQAKPVDIQYELTASADSGTIKYTVMAKVDYLKDALRRKGYKP